MDFTPFEAGSYVMSITPFDERGRFDEDTLREHVRWQVAEGINVVPASLATGEGSLLTDDEIFRLWDIVVEEAAARFPVLGTSREYPTAAENLRFAKEAESRGLDGLLIYPPVIGHGITPTPEMFEAYYDELLPRINLPVLVSNNQVSGFEVPMKVHERLLDRYENISGFYKHHVDIMNCAAFYARVAPKTTLFTGFVRFPTAFLLGGTSQLDNLQNIAPRTSRKLHDALHKGDLAVANEAFARIVEIVGATARFAQEERTAGVPVSKGILRALGRPGSYFTRPPYRPLSREQESRLAKLVEQLELRELEGLS